MMDILEKDKNGLSAIYLECSQIAELVGDIEGCANKLADAAKIAKAKIEKYKNNLREKETSTCD